MWTIDKLSSSLAAAISEKVIAHFADVRSDLTSAKIFLEANSAQQAATSIDLKETASHQATATSNLATVATKLATIDTITKLTPSPPAWPSIPPTLPHPPPAIPNTFNPKVSTHHTRIQQRLLLAARSLLIQLAPTQGNTPLNPSPTAISKLRDDLNKELHSLDELEFAFHDDVNIRNTKTSIRGIKPLERGAYLLDLDSAESVARFKAYAAEPTSSLISSHFGESASIRLKGHNLVFKFVPCTGDFDPSNPNHLSELEYDNNLSPNSITSATWLKRPDRRSPTQTSASLKVVCSTPESANHLLSERVYVAGHSITVTKDLREPIRCNKCQVFGHVRTTCQGPETCAHCASKSHVTAECPPGTPPGCVSCGPAHRRAGCNRGCPAFLKLGSDLDARHPENSMPYFPTGESWTWAFAPVKRSIAPPTHVPRAVHPPLTHPSDDGWSSAPPPAAN